MLPAKISRVFRGVKYNITIKSNTKVFVPYEEGVNEVNVEV